MGFFNQFTDTVFLKNDSELERQIIQLEELYKTNKDDLIEKDLKLLKAGFNGEKSLEFELKNNNIGMYVLHDINLVYEDFTAQIDYIVFTSAHCYFIECKNMIGNITVNHQGQFTREFIYNNKRMKQAIYSPYSQAQRHKEIFKKIWASNKNYLIQKLSNDTFEDYYKPLVVFMNPNGILNIRYAPKEIKKSLIRCDQINEYLKKDIKNTKTLYSRKNMETIANTILSKHQNITHDYLSKYKNKSFINKEELKQKLLSFRKEKSSKYNIPAYYIFTNNQLESLLSLMPKDINELRKADILETVKINLHGQEIIDIINSQL